MDNSKCSECGSENVRFYLDNTVEGINYYDVHCLECGDFSQSYDDENEERDV